MHASCACVRALERRSGSGQACRRRRDARRAPFPCPCAHAGTPCPCPVPLAVPRPLRRRTGRLQKAYKNLCKLHDIALERMVPCLWLLRAYVSWSLVRRRLLLVKASGALAIVERTDALVELSRSAMHRCDKNKLGIQYLKGDCSSSDYETTKCNVDTRQGIQGIDVNKLCTMHGERPQEAKMLIQRRPPIRRS